MCDTLQSIEEIDDIQVARIIECDNAEDLRKEVCLNKNDFTITLQNIRSIYCNFDNFLPTLSSFSFQSDVVIFTECYYFYDTNKL